MGTLPQFAFHHWNFQILGGKKESVPNTASTEESSGANQFCNGRDFHARQSAYEPN
jgi:hypothetical protein